MITARNYAAQCERGLAEFIRLASSHTHPAGTWTLVERFIADIPKAVHFALPDGGRVMEDELRGIDGLSIRLPFPLITIEYWTEQERFSDATPSSCSKRVAMAREIDMGDHLAIEVTVASYSDDRKLWVPMALMGLIEWGRDSGGRSIEPLVPAKSATRIPVRVRPFLGQDYVEAVVRRLSFNALVHDITDEITATLDLVEALSCSNVHHERFSGADSATNQRRERDGKVPIYETRRLMVNVPQATTERRDLGGHHASPRQHLRRGHIRRLPDKNIWVNSHLVGNPEKGRIDKQYAVKKEHADNAALQR